MVSLDSITKGFLNKLESSGAPPIYTLPVEQARQVLEGAQSDAPPMPEAEVEELAGLAGAMIVRPSGLSQDGKSPAILYFHGGGWILGSFQTHERLVRRLAEESNACVVFLDYQRSPEARYPAPLEQAFDAYRHLTERGASYGIDPRRIAVAGDSAGGNMAAATTLTALARGAMKPRAQVLFYPVASAALDTPSYREFAEGPWLTRKAMEWFWNAYAPFEDDRRKPDVSLVLASKETLAPMPETLVMMAEADVLRDEGEQFARHLTEAGVAVTAMRYLGAIHDFAMLNALAETPAARHATRAAGEFLRRCLR